MDQGNAVPHLSRYWRRVYLLQLPGTELEGIVSFEDGVWLARAIPALPDEVLGLHWGQEYDAEHDAMVSVERYIKDNSL